MEDFKVTNLLEGRPDNITNVKEKICYDTLDKLNIQYQRVEYNFFPKNIDDLKLIDQRLEVDGIKNLVFKTKNKNEFFLIILLREERFEEKKFRIKHGISKITMASESDLKELLNTHIGAVSIMELVNDKDSKIKLYIDKKILDMEHFRFHPNENNATVRITVDGLKNKLIPYLKHEINIL